MISSSLIPDARYDTTSDTLIRRPRMHGRPRASCLFDSLSPLTTTGLIDRPMNELLLRVAVAQKIVNVSDILRRRLTGGRRLAQKRQRGERLLRHAGARLPTPLRHERRP